MGKFDGIKKRGEEIVKEHEAIPIHRQPLYRALRAIKHGRLRICYEVDRDMLHTLDAIKSEIQDTQGKKLPRKALMDYAIQYAIKNGLFFQGKWWK
jgi:hypothetical protein